jgi:hypothetical protein
MAQTQALPSLQEILQSSGEIQQSGSVPSTIQYWRNKMADTREAQAQKMAGIKSFGETGLQMNKQMRQYAIARVANPKLTFKQFMSNPEVASKWLKDGSEMVAQNPGLAPKGLEAWKTGLGDIFDKDRWAKGVMNQELDNQFMNPLSKAKAEMGSLGDDIQSGLTNSTQDLGVSSQELGSLGADKADQLLQYSNKMGTKALDPITYQPMSLNAPLLDAGATTGTPQEVINRLKQSGEYLGGGVSPTEVQGIGNQLARSQLRMGDALKATDISKVSPSVDVATAGAESAGGLKDFLGGAGGKALAGIGGGLSLASGIKDISKRGLDLKSGLKTLGGGLGLASMFIPGLNIAGLLAGGLGTLSGLGDRKRR